MDDDLSFDEKILIFGEIPQEEEKEEDVYSKEKIDKMLKDL